MVFSTNQVRQLYVVKNVTSGKPGYTECVDKNGEIYFKQVNALGTPVRSDLVKKDNILWVSTTTPEQGKTPIKSVKVTLDSTVNEGNPIAGEDYILNIYIRQYVGMSDTDIYVKQGFVRGYADMTPAQFYEQLKVSLERNFAREPYPLLKFEAVEDGVIITEVEQEWRLGLKEQVPVYFDVHPTNVITNGDERIWGVVEDTTPKKQEDGSYSPALTEENSRSNGKTIADLEYFCMGERADMYRGIGWPHNLETKYLVDPSEEYYTVTIHYSYIGAGENPQKSEKDIVLVSSDKDTINAILAKIPDTKQFT